MGRTDGRCYLYILEAIGVDRFKIGSSIDPEGRKKTAATYCPFPVVLRYAAPGRRGDEGEAHAELVERRAHGEWFHGPLEDIVAAVDKVVSRNQTPP